MSKSLLHLSIENDLKELAKKSNLNLSQEFEQWIRIRLNANINEDDNMDHDLEIAKLRQEISKLESQKELMAKQEMKDKEEEMIIDHAIDNEMESNKDIKPEDIPSKRSHGLVYLFNMKFRKSISDMEATNMIENRMKERGLL